MSLAVERLRQLPPAVLKALLDELAEPAEFASDEHETFFASRHPELVASGWMGAGKSRVLTQKAWMVARRYPGVTVALFRKAQNSIAHTTERTFERDVLDRSYIARRNKTEHFWELTNGSRIYFLGLDPDPITGVPSKVGSMDLGWAGVDEAVELTEEDWIMLLGRLRDPRMPWHQLAAATNPGPPKHWLRMRMLASTERLMLAIRSNKFLTPEYVAMLANLPDTAAGRRLGRGEWAAAEGVIWTLPQEQVRYEAGPWKMAEAGLDWGFVHAFACEVLGISGSGRLAVIDEVHEQGLTIDQIIPILQIVRDKHNVRTFWADPSEPGYILQCQRAGLPVEPAHNAVSPGIDAVSSAIARGMTVDPACTGLLGELPGYTWAPNKAGGFHERPIEINDDACVTGDTLVWTRRGQVRITDVTTDDEVMTRVGWRSVVAYGQTGTRPTVMVSLSDGRSLTCTPDHRLWTQNGWVVADALRYDDVVCTRPPLATRLAASGLARTVRSLLGRTSTTATGMSRTTSWSTWSVSGQANTWIVTSPLGLTPHLRDLSISIGSDLLPRNGIELKRAGIGTVSMPPRRGSVTLRGVNWSALTADVLTSEPKAGSAPTRASLHGGGPLVWMRSIGRALAAARRSASTAIRGSVTVRAVVEGSRLAVYNLAVEGQSEYFANGVLIHNCDALRYGVVGITRALEENPWAALAGQRVGGVA